MEQIPSAICHVVGDVLAAHYSHTDLETLLIEHGAPGEPPAGTKVVKVTAWLKRASADPNVDAIALLGSIPVSWTTTTPPPSNTAPRVRGG